MMTKKKKGKIPVLAGERTEPNPDSPQPEVWDSPKEIKNQAKDQFIPIFLSEPETDARPPQWDLRSGFFKHWNCIIFPATGRWRRNLVPSSLVPASSLFLILEIVGCWGGLWSLDIIYVETGKTGQRKFFGLTSSSSPRRITLQRQTSNSWLKRSFPTLFTPPCQTFFYEGR